MKKLILFIAAALAAAACTPQKHTVRFVTYNVGVFHKADTNTIPMVADMLEEIDADVVSLNELDSCTVRTGKEFQLGSLVKELGGWDYRYAWAIPYQGGKYGVGIASKPEYKIQGFKKIFLPKEESKEQRVLAVAEYKDFIFATTHLDYSSPSDQLKQAQKVTEFMMENYAKCGKAVFLCGDMNAAPDSETMKFYKNHWTILSAQDFTIPATKPRLCIDYIMVLNGTAECNVLETAVLTEFEKGDVKIASDHLPVMAVVEF